MQEDQFIKEKRCTCCKKVRPIADFISSLYGTITKRCSNCRETGQRAHRKYVGKHRAALNAHYNEYFRDRQNEPTGDPDKRRCKKCLKALPLTEFSVSTAGTFYQRCDGCRTARRETMLKQWRKRTPEVIQKRTRYLLDKKREQRLRVLAHYGTVCFCCGENHEELLSIDHIDGNGNRHRREIPTSGFYKWLEENNFPSGFRTLCHNCNWSAYRHSGKCIHQLEREAGAVT